MKNDDNTLFSLAREHRLLSFLNLDGAAALTLCAECGVTPDTFYGAKERALYELALELNTSRQLVGDGVILGEEAVEKRHLMEWNEFVGMTAQVPSHGVAPAELPPLCRALKAMEKKREIKRHSLGITEALKGHDQDAISSALSKLQNADLSERPRASWKQVAGVQIEQAKAIIDGKEDPDMRSVSWPWRSFDAALKPFRRGEQVVVAGYTSNGKSSLLRQLAMHSAKCGLNVAFVSLEVPTSDIFNLMTAAHAGQSWSRLKELHPSDQRAFVDGARAVRELPIEVLDDASSLPAILAWIRNLHARRFVDVVAIDYLGLIAECSPQRGQTKAAAVGEVACALKRLASELQCVVFLAVQINRGPTSDGNREPKLSDLKDSGDIEAHADRALLLYRPDTDRVNNTQQGVHEPEADRPKFYMELFQEKGRNVGTGSVRVWFRRAMARFEEVAA